MNTLQIDTDRIVSLWHEYISTKIPLTRVQFGFRSKDTTIESIDQEGMGDGDAQEAEPFYIGREVQTQFKDSGRIDYEATTMLAARELKERLEEIVKLLEIECD